MKLGAISIAVGRRLQRLRLERGIPLARLAKTLGVTESALRRIEDGLTQPSLGMVADLAWQLGTSPAALVRGATDASTQSKDFARLDPEQLGRAIVELPHAEDKLELVEAAAVRYALRLAGGNKAAAARLLGIERQAMGRRLRKFKS
jgi:transcriptional regulator with XRE-family HTH domain